MAVREVRQELAGRVLWRRCEVEVAADQQRLDVRVLHVGVLVLVRVCRPGVEDAAAGPDQVGAGRTDQRSTVCSRREEAPRVRRVAAADRRHVAPDLRAREDELRHQRQEPRTARVALVGGEEGVDRQWRGDRAAAVGGLVDQAEERGGFGVAFLDRQEQPVIGNVSERGLQRRGEIRCPVTTARVLGAERRVATDLLAGCLRVPEEVAGRVDADHHRAVDALRVAPGVDHRGAGARAFADQVDPVVAEGAAGELEVVDAFGDGVAGQIDAVAAEPVGARPVRRGVGAERPLAEEVARVLP